MFATFNKNNLNLKSSNDSVFNEEIAEPELFPIVPHILLVEDVPMCQVMIKSLLEKLGCCVVLARSGKEAIHFFERGFDLVLMDIGLPDSNGFEVTRCIRDKFPNEPTPIIACSANEVSENEYVPAGMNGLIRKGFGMEQLYKVIKRHLVN